MEVVVVRQTYWPNNPFVEDRFLSPGLVLTVPDDAEVKKKVKELLGRQVFMTKEAYMQKVSPTKVVSPKETAKESTKK